MINEDISEIRPSEIEIKSCNSNFKFIRSVLLKSNLKIYINFQNI